MAAQNYYTGDANLPPHPQLHSPAPPPYTEHASPRPQPSPQMSGGLGPKPPQGRNPSPYRLPPQQQQAYRPQQQPPPAQWVQQQDYRPSQQYYQPQSSQQYPLHQPSSQQGPYPSPNPYPPGVQRPQPYPQQTQQSLHPHQAHSQFLPQQQNAYRPPPQQRPPYDDLADKPSHNNHHHHHHTKRRSKSDSGRDTFLGAGGGAILGDVLIGPGVGTLGAAILGGLAGNKHAKEKERRNRSSSGRRSLSRDSKSGR